MGDLPINTQIMRARLSDAGLIRAAVLAIPFFMIAPALWNGYPLLQWDTGGYLARWYEGYLVPSRSTVFGLYLHLGEGTNFWTNLVLQALATFWIIQTTLRVLGAKQRLTLVAICLLLILTTALPWLASMLLTDIFAGLSVLSLYLLVLHGERLSAFEKIGLFRFHRLCRGDPQRHARRASRSLRPRLRRAAVAARPDLLAADLHRDFSPSQPAR